MIEWLVKNELQRRERRWSWPNLEYCTSMFVERLRITTENLCQNSLCELSFEPGTSWIWSRNSSHLIVTCSMWQWLYGLNYLPKLQKGPKIWLVIWDPDLTIIIILWIIGSWVYISFILPKFCQSLMSEICKVEQHLWVSCCQNWLGTQAYFILIIKLHCIRIVSHVWMTIDGVWIGNWIYWTPTDSNYLTSWSWALLEKPPIV
jgi:hypothetical protein